MPLLVSQKIVQGSFRLLAEGDVGLVAVVQLQTVAVTGVLDYRRDMLQVDQIGPMRFEEAASTKSGFQLL